MLFSDFSNSELNRFLNYAADQLAALKRQGVDGLHERSFLLAQQFIELAVALLVERELLEDVEPERVKDISDAAIQRIYQSLLVDIADEIHREIRLPPTSQQMTDLINGRRNRFPLNVPEEDQ